MVARTVAVVLMGVLFGSPWCSLAASDSAVPPTLTRMQIGKIVESVSIETYGVTKPIMARRYLSMHSGDRLTQQRVDQDFLTLWHVGGYRARLEIDPGSSPDRVRLHWIVNARWIKPTSHPFYGDAPLSAPIQGVGFILTAPPLDARGTNFSSYTQLSRRANLARLLFTVPLEVDPKTGSESSFIADAFGGRGVYRASEPLAINVYSWTTGVEALFLKQSVNGTQVEGGMRVTRSTDQANSSIETPSLYNTFEHPARATQFVAGVSHACKTLAYQWYPPYCSTQYRFQVTDGIGGLGATQQYRILSADVVRYFAVGTSTVAFHASTVRTGGVLPDSFLLCATVRGYPKPFCGTDAEGGTFEYRINDRKHPPLEWVLFTEDASSRVRGGTQSYALPYFTWHPDSGIGLEYHALRLDLAYGRGGGRLTFELRGQLY